MENCDGFKFWNILAEILEQIAAEHFKIELQREMQMSRIEIEKFYKEHKDEPYFEELLDNMARYSYMARPF